MIDPNVITGFDEKHMPDKKWLINVWHFFKPKDDCFTQNKKVEEAKKLDFVTEEYFWSLLICYIINNFIFDKWSQRELRNIVKRKTKKIQLFGKSGEEKLVKLELAHKKR